jgi:hypothetical protein
LTYPRFKALKIASVQHDTLSHVIHARGTMSGAEENGWELKELARRAKKYYEATDEEVSPRTLAKAIASDHVQRRLTGTDSLLNSFPR